MADFLKLVSAFIKIAFSSPTSIGDSKTPSTPKLDQASDMYRPLTFQPPSAIISGK